MKIYGHHLPVNVCIADIIHRSTRARIANAGISKSTLLKLHKSARAILLDESVQRLAQVTLTKSDERSCTGADLEQVSLDNEYLAMVLCRHQLERRWQQWIAQNPRIWEWSRRMRETKR